MLCSAVGSAFGSLGGCFGVLILQLHALGNLIRIRYRRRRLLRLGKHMRLMACGLARYAAWSAAICASGRLLSRHMQGLGILQSRCRYDREAERVHPPGPQIAADRPRAISRLDALMGWGGVVLERPLTHSRLRGCETAAPIPRRACSKSLLRAPGIAADRPEWPCRIGLGRIRLLRRLHYSRRRGPSPPPPSVPAG